MEEFYTGLVARFVEWAELGTSIFIGQLEEGTFFFLSALIY
jgi:hypothetical protein